MDIRVLQYFLAVAREESITKAAQSLHMTQPPLSRQLKDLEDEVGKQLLIRGSKKVTLTDSQMDMVDSPRFPIILCQIFCLNGVHRVSFFLR